MEWGGISVPFQDLMEHTLSMELLHEDAAGPDPQGRASWHHHSNPRDAEIHSHASKISCILLYAQMRFFYMEWLS